MPREERRSELFSVSVTRCSTYDGVAVRNAIQDCLGNLGGMSAFVSKGETILLKPNMLSARPPEQAITTHPEFVRAAIRLVRDAGGVPIVGDTPSGRTTEPILKNLAEKTGISRVCEEEGVDFVHFVEPERIPYPQGVVAKSFELAKEVKRVGGIISLAKFKTHSFTGLTGAVKNLFGLIPGLRKAEYHFRMQSVEAFSELLVDLAECVKPRLTIMDGIVGMEGDGPAAGKTRQIGLVVSSTSTHALDAFMLEIAGADPESVPTVNIARRRGLIPADQSQIVVLGGDRSSFGIKDFEMPSGLKPYGRIPRTLGWWFGEVVSRKPVFSKADCDLCGLCIEACPAKALIEGAKRPRVDRRLCIRCYCCQEICMSNAIRLKRIPGRSVYRAMSGRAMRAFERRGA